jgi:hypothetical protein
MKIVFNFLIILDLIFSPGGFMVGMYADTCLATAVLIHFPEPKDPFAKPTVGVPIKHDHPWDDDTCAIDPDCFDEVEI